CFGGVEHNVSVTVDEVTAVGVQDQTEDTPWQPVQRSTHRNPISALTRIGEHFRRLKHILPCIGRIHTSLLEEILSVKQVPGVPNIRKAQHLTVLFPEIDARRK